MLSSEISAVVRLSKHEDNSLYHDACLCLVSMNFLKILIAYFIFVLLKNIKIFSTAPLVTEETLTTIRPHYIFDTRPLVEYIMEYVKNNWQKFVIFLTIYPTTVSTTTAK